MQSSASETALRNISQPWQSRVGFPYEKDGRVIYAGCGCDPFLPCDPCDSPCGGKFQSEISFSAVSMGHKGFAVPLC